MKKAIGKTFILFLVIAGIILLLNVPFVVHPKEYVVVKQFGRIVSTCENPGLYAKIPFIQSTQRISTATILYDIPQSDVITKDKKTMIADNYVLWKVSNPTRYIQTLNAVEARANERVEAAVYNATKNVISSMTQDDVIAARGDKLTDMITQQSNTDIGEYGIVIIQSQIKTLDLPNDNKEAVYTRMISERNNIAASYKAEGEAKAQKIRNETDKETAIMRADAKKQAATIEAEGEAEYMRVISQAYNDPDKADFYEFTRSLDALGKSLKGKDKTIILDKDSQLVRLLYGQ